MARSLVLLGGTILAAPDADAVDGGVVLVQGGRIAYAGVRDGCELPGDATIVDCAGKTIVAGFWNSHVHFFERKWANAGEIPEDELARQLSGFTRHGFTNVFDLSSQWTNTRTLRERIVAGEVAGPSIRSTGEGLVPPGAMPAETVLRVLGVANVPLPEIENGAQARAAAEALLDAGVDGVKLFLSAPSGAHLPEDAIAAVASAAHDRNKLLFAHPNTGDDVLRALRNGVDVIAHTTPRGGPWNDEILTAVQHNGTALTPTLQLWRHGMRHDRLSAQDAATQTAVEQLRSWRAAGGVVLFGTDDGAVDHDPRGEYELMAAAGMDWRAILASLTAVPAQRFGAPDGLGRVRAGMQADLVVLGRDPRQDIGAFADVEYTVRMGKPVWRR